MNIHGAIDRVGSIFLIFFIEMKKIFFCTAH